MRRIDRISTDLDKLWRMIHQFLDMISNVNHLGIRVLLEGPLKILPDLLRSRWERQPFRISLVFARKGRENVHA